jgi:hypothetical protein
MSFFEDASLVLIPSAYKDQKIYSVKPTDGTGDLTFSRASSATRVQSDGLIEKVRTNLILYSEQFNDASWSVAVNASVTANATTAPNGTTTADKIVEDTATSQHIIGQTPTSINSVGHTISVYAKAAERSFLFLFEDSAGGRNAYFDLSNGTIGTLGGSATASITSVGNGWYRCSVTYTASGTLVRMRVAPATANGTNSYTGDGTSGIFVWGAQVEVSDFGATDYIATTTASVSVGPVSGLPRLDYLGSTCPRLLLESQRTNLVTYSEQLNTSSGGTSVVTANTIASPDGYVNADTIGTGFWSKTTSQAAGTYTLSVFAKYQSTASFLFYIYDGAYYTGSFNLQTGVATTSTGSPSVSMVNYGNGWYRCILTATTASTISEVGFGSGNFYAYGLQLETGAYATSYIPTLGASVTRVADAASKTGISSLIGQTEGTIFFEMVLSNTNQSVNRLISIVGTTGAGWSDNSIRVDWNSSGNLSYDAAVGAASSFGGVSSNVYTAGQTIKVAVAYKANDTVMYVNGVQAAVDTTTVGIPACSVFALNELYGFSSGSFELHNWKQALLFKTRLTNAQLAELTA